VTAPAYDPGARPDASTAMVSRAGVLPLAGVTRSHGTLALAE
jgi:hypothetical protein